MPKFSYKKFFRIFKIRSKFSIIFQNIRLIFSKFIFSKRFPLNIFKIFLNFPEKFTSLPISRFTLFIKNFQIFTEFFHPFPRSTFTRNYFKIFPKFAQSFLGTSLVTSDILFKFYLIRLHNFFRFS